MKIGTCIPTRYYEKAAAMGYDYMEAAGTEIYGMSDDEFSLFLERVKAIGLPVNGYNSYCDEKAPVVGEQFSVEKAAAYAEKMAERGRSLGIKTIGIGSPGARVLPESYPLNKANHQAVQFLKATSDVGKKYGQKVLFEAVHNHMTDYCNTTPHALKIVEMCADENIKLVLDFYHMEVMGEDITDISYVMDKVIHLHVNHLMEDYGRMYITEGDRPMLERIATAVKACGYNGTISIEAEGKYFEEYGEEGLRVMRKVFNW